MTNYIMRIALVGGISGFLMSTLTGGLLECAYAQSAKSKPKPQASGQMLCNAQGCRPVAPGCRLEQPKAAPHGSTQTIEVCN
jgi:hypothetical protein